MATTELSGGSSKGSDSNLAGSSNAAYSVIYHDGLEVVDHDNGPEVVSSTMSLNGKSNMRQPEAYHAVPYYSDKKGHHSYYENPHALTPEHEVPQYLDTQEGKEAIGGVQGAFGGLQGASPRKEQRRCCGMRRGVFIVIMVAVAFIVCIGVILGAVLGTVLPKKSTSGNADSSLQSTSGTGLASTLSGDGSGRLLTYYQDPAGRIIENSYMDGTWTLQDQANINFSVVTTQATLGSQLAAISFPYGGKTYRQVFWVSPTGGIMTANTTETTDGIATKWGPGISISTDRIDPKGIGLAACWSDKTMNGIRAFYPSQWGYIQEMKWTFGEDKWVEGAAMLAADPSTGIGCAMKDGASDQYLNLYYRNRGSGRVKQAFVLYDGKGNYHWTYDAGPKSWGNRTIAIGSDIAVCGDDSQTEYVYYQMPGGLVTRGLVNPSAIDYENFENQAGATIGSKLSCSFVDGGSMLFFQNRTSTSTIYATDVSRSGVSISNFVVP